MAKEPFPGDSSPVEGTGPSGPPEPWGRSCQGLAAESTGPVQPVPRGSTENGIQKWLETEPLGAVLPKSDFADGLRYLRNHWQALNAYVDDGRIPSITTRSNA